MTTSSSPPVRPGQPATEAISSLLREHGAELYWVAVRMCGNRDEADDLVQETSLQAFRKWEQFEGRGEARAWLFTIAGRLCHRMHRRRAGEPARLEPLSELIPLESPDVAVPPGEGELGRQVERECRKELETAVAALPPAFRIPLVLKEIGGLSLGEIAEVLGLKGATVKTRVHRARLKLRQALVRKLPRQVMPSAAYSRRICLDLLQAKQEALDRGVRFPIQDELVCERCRALFATLDLTSDLCREISRGGLPEGLLEAVFERLQHLSGTDEDGQDRE